MARKQSQGKCELCKGTFPKAAMTRHLAKCLVEHEKASAPGKSKTGDLVHIVAEGRSQPEYWLHVEMAASTPLDDLDSFLRDIWLECCGHLSAFRFEGKRHRPQPISLDEMFSADYSDPNDVKMSTPVGRVLSKGEELGYEYDFGSTTALKVKGVGERTGRLPHPGKVRLLARNDPPVILCGVCGKNPATLIDMENSWDPSGWLCPACAEEAGVSEEERTLPVVNSPRTGVCGYTGN